MNKLEMQLTGNTQDRLDDRLNGKIKQITLIRPAHTQRSQRAPASAQPVGITTSQPV